MAQGYSLHLGIDKINKEVYGDQQDTLTNAVNSAKVLQSLVERLNYQTPEILIDEQVTVEIVVNKVKEIAEKAKADDLFLLTFSGHGKQNDKSIAPKEHDLVNEYWCFYDKPLKDEDLILLLEQFAKGVRVLIISDSCYSGGMLGNKFVVPKKLELYSKENHAYIKEIFNKQYK